ncbi:hypothetical protein ElyMa_003948000 [Elysia marginata]|uniref:Uncharacterized protein n=1 Tax=Elysia marginata TaxID=1093978 RepID=A0AAV4FV64_9GAST|nr:hypothetical protein ElyMa_003948000 [Elysia marginata]
MMSFEDDWNVQAFNQGSPRNGTLIVSSLYLSSETSLLKFSPPTPPLTPPTPPTPTPTSPTPPLISPTHPPTTPTQLTPPLTPPQTSKTTLPYGPILKR